MALTTLPCATALACDTEKLKNAVSTEQYGIGAKIIENILNIIIKSLNAMYNLSIQIGLIDEDHDGPKPANKVSNNLHKLSFNISLVSLIHYTRKTDV
jgi:hypothetical protein